jgi:ribosomal protein S9
MTDRVPQTADSERIMENERRARLYDQLWMLAWTNGPITLTTGGTHGVDYSIMVRGGGVRGDLATVEKWLTNPPHIDRSGT